MNITSGTTSLNGYYRTMLLLAREVLIEMEINKGTQ
jgi:hypothetical protein